jgi:hypothetical protein
MAGLGLALQLVSLGASAFSAAQSAQANNSLRRKLLERSSTLDSVFAKDSNIDYMETPGVKNTLASYGKNLKDIQKNSEGRAVMAGSSPEAVIAEKEAVNQNYGDFIRKVASGQDAYRAEKERMYNIRRDSLDNQIFASDQQKASQWDNVAKNAANLGVAGISAGAIQEDNPQSAGSWLKSFLKKTKPGSTLPADWMNN